MRKDDLLALIADNAGRITTGAAREAGFPNTLLSLLEREGAVELETRGVWALADTPLDDFAVVALRWPRLAFSHGSALYLNGLSDRVPSFLELRCPRGYRPTAIAREFPGLIVRTAMPDSFQLGLTNGTSPTGTPLKLYDSERCICDILLERRRGQADLQLLRDAVTGYMKSRSKDLPKLARYAKELGVQDELRVYTEVIA